MKCANYLGQTPFFYRRNLSFLFACICFSRVVAPVSVLLKINTLWFTLYSSHFAAHYDQSFYSGLRVSLHVVLCDLFGIVNFILNKIL